MAHYVMRSPWPTHITRPSDNFFDPPHGGRPPSDEAVHAATQRYIDQERAGKLKNLPVSSTYRGH